MPLCAAKPTSLFPLVGLYPWLLVWRARPGLTVQIFLCATQGHSEKLCGCVFREHFLAGYSLHRA